MVLSSMIANHDPSVWVVNSLVEFGFPWCLIWIESWKIWSQGLYNLFKKANWKHHSRQFPRTSTRFSLMVASGTQINIVAGCCLSCVGCASSWRLACLITLKHSYTKTELALPNSNSIEAYSSVTLASRTICMFPSSRSTAHNGQTTCIGNSRKTSWIRQRSINELYVINTSFACLYASWSYQAIRSWQRTSTPCQI